MNVKYEKKPEMTFIGYHTEIRPEEGYQKCPEFWDKEFAAKYTRLWQTMKPETEIEKAILENEITEPIGDVKRFRKRISTEKDDGDESSSDKNRF